jgi:hypothetical protein
MYGWFNTNEQKTGLSDNVCGVICILLLFLKATIFKLCSPELFLK